MTTPYPPKAPKRLERSRSDKFLFGVCGGLARYLNLDPTLVRILTVVLTLFFAVPAIVYLVAAFVMPEETSPSTPAVYPPTGAWTGPTAPADPIWGTAGAPWEAPPNQSQPPAPSDPEAPIVPPANSPTAAPRAEEPR